MKKGKRHKWNNIYYPKKCLRCEGELLLNHPLASKDKYYFSTDKAVFYFNKLKDIPKCID